MRARWLVRSSWAPRCRADKWLPWASRLASGVLRLCGGCREPGYWLPMLADVIDVQHGDVVLVLGPPLGLVRVGAKMMERARLGVRVGVMERARCRARAMDRGERQPHLVLVSDVDSLKRVRLLRTGAGEHALGHVAQGAAGLGE